MISDRTLQQYVTAAMTVDNIGTGSIDEPGSAAIKSAVSDLYHELSHLSNFSSWNWGISDPETRSSIASILPDLELISDGYSEQLYYYVFRRAMEQSSEANDSLRILEIGSGSGAGLNFLARIEPGFEYIGVDLTPSAVELANATYSRREILRYTCGDAEDLPFEDAEFDIVLSIESSHAYPNLEKFITEVSRVLRIGGTFGHADVFSESRLRSFRQLKTLDLFQWAEESDISTIVRASIAERISSDSKLRQSLTSADADKADLMLDLYGRPFLYMDRIPATDSDRLMESSYRVSIARRI